MFMEKDNVYRAAGYHTTIGQMVQTLQAVEKNVIAKYGNSDIPCYYIMVTPSDVIYWDKDIEFSEEFANDVVDNLWYYNQTNQMIRKMIENEIELQLKEKNLTLDNFRLPEE